MNDITGDDPGLQSPYTEGMSVDSNATASGIDRGSGITGRSGDDRYNAKSWSTGARDADDYFTFTMDANDGYEIDFTSFTYTGQASSQGPQSFELRSSLDNYSSTIGSPTADGTTIDLSAAEFQDITGPVEFRLYGYDAGSNSGTFSVNDYKFEGEVNPVPEPQTLALLGIGTSLLLLNRRKMQLGNKA